MNKEKYYVASLSGGKDSTAMVLELIRRNYPVDEIIYCDTGLEFPEMTEHIDRIEQYIGRPITRLKAEKDFMYYAAHHKYTSMKNGNCVGWGWPSMFARWCTRHLKLDVLEKYYKTLNDNYEVHQYVGIAVDEPNRIKDSLVHHYPLVDWNMTEKQCLEYCYEHGFWWGGYMNIFPELVVGCVH